MPFMKLLVLTVILLNDNCIMQSTAVPTFSSIISQAECNPELVSGAVDVASALLLPST